MAERILVRKVTDSHWQWRLLTSQGEWANDAYYSGDINLLRESIEGKAVWLYIPGGDVASCVVDADVKDRRMLAKLIPFEVEESIIDLVDDLAFAYGPLHEGSLPVAYVNASIAETAINELEEIGADVQHVLPDYLGLAYHHGEVVLLFDGQSILAKTSAGTGFSIEKDLAPTFLAAYFEQALPAHVHLIAGDQEELEQLRSFLPEQLTEMEDIEYIESEGGYWDSFSTEDLAVNPILDFRTGQLARKLPFGQWWNDWKVPAIAAGVAFLVAVGSAWWELQNLRSEQREIFTQRDEIYRQVVPKGAISDPVRQLKGKLGGESSSEPSNFMYMVSKVSPPIAAEKQLSLTNMRYNHDSGELQLSVEAPDFALFEALRSKIDQSGLKVEIKRASVSGDVHQARILVSEGRS